MREVNKIILQLASLQASLLMNANAYDDDLEQSWETLKDDYERLKESMNRYIDKGEK